MRKKRLPPRFFALARGSCGWYRVVYRAVAKDRGKLLYTARVRIVAAADSHRFLIARARMAVCSCTRTCCVRVRAMRGLYVAPARERAILYTRVRLLSRRGDILRELGKRDEILRFRGCNVYLWQSTLAVIFR